MKAKMSYGKSEDKSKPAKGKMPFGKSAGASAKKMSSKGAMPKGKK